MKTNNTHKIQKEHKEDYKGYKPHEGLVDHLFKRLQNEQRYQKFKNAGGDWSDEYQRERKELLRMKVYVLDKYIFQSMANIVTFLEYCYMYPTLQQVFEEDIEELLLGAIPKELGKVKADSNPKSKSKAIEELSKSGLFEKQLWWLSNDYSWLKIPEYWDQPIIARFLHAVFLTWPGEDNQNFRVKILSIIVRIIFQYIRSTAQQVLAPEGDPSLETPAGSIANEKFHEIVNNELVRIIVFAELLAKNAVVKKSTPNRPVLF